MKLTRIRIEQFKQFRQPLDITDLEPGINLFTGPNEAGKSTIVTAIRAAFFERHRSGSVDDLRPWGDSTASPTVELEFVIDDQRYRLTKSFLAKKRCELQIGTERLDGADAEDRLSELLGFQHAGKGASKAEHWGIPGLLWIQQGSAHEIREPVAHATDHLRSALNESLGEVASSGGDGVLATVQEQRNALLTAATGKPRGAYAEAIEQEAGLGNAIRELDTQIATYRQKVDTLAVLRREHEHDAEEKPWFEFRSRQQAASEKLEAIGRIEESLATEQRHAGQVDERIALLREHLESFAAQERAVETRRAAQESAKQALSKAAALAGQWDTNRTEAVTRHEATRETLRIARAEDTRRALTRQCEEIRRKAEQAVAALVQAEAEQTSLLDLQRQAAASEITLADLNTLREHARHMRELDIRQSAAATRLRFALHEDCRIQVGSESVGGTGERLLIEATTVTLPGLGSVDIAPGGADLGQLRREAADLADRRTALLQRLGVSSLDAAETRYQLHAQRVADIKTAATALKLLAPNGVEALRAEVASHQVRALEIEGARCRLPAPADQAVVSVAEAESAEDEAAKSLANINENLHRAQLASGNAQAQVDAAVRELGAALAVLDAPDRAERLAAANRDLVDARADKATLSARIETLTRQVTDARPDILKQDVERFRKSAEQHEKSFAERKNEIMRIEVELQAAGAQGLEERRAELARDLAQVQRRVEELRRRAGGLDHLLNLLRTKRHALTRRLQAPLQKHLNRYLQLLFPQATLEIDEHLAPGPLTRMKNSGAESGEFEALSFGAREQMGVISRLAYADLLREAGRPTLIILDDALVHSDEERLSQMKRVLFDAATRHQILLFTCHPEKWRDLGVSARSLVAMRAAA